MQHRPADAQQYRAVAPPHLGVALILSVVVALWLRLVAPAPVGSTTGLQALALDAMLVSPAAVAALWLAGRLTRDLDAAWHPPIVGAAVGTLALSALLVPLLMLRGRVQVLIGAGGSHDAPGASDWLHGGWSQAVRHTFMTEPVVFAAALVLFGLVHAPVRFAELCAPAVRLGRIAMVALVAAAVPGVPTSLPTAAGATESTDTTTAASRGCADPAVPTRTYEVSALSVDMVLNRFGDHDPFGYMYVLRQNEAAVRAFAAATTGTHPTRKVSTGLRDDPIQPLVLRARLGECVVITLTNKITLPPRAGNDLPVGGVPPVSIDVQGVSYQIADGGSSVGDNPADRMTPAGRSNTYRFYLDPLTGTGGKIFHSDGDARQLTAHGLFGAIVAEPAGARWYDPRTGADRTDDASWNSWEAMVRPGTGATFREFALMYHEQGDEDSHLRRPLTEGPGTDGLGRLVPMVDDLLPSEVPRANNTGDEPPIKDGAGTQTYRPDGRAINYRSEPFWRRLQQLGSTVFTGLSPAQLGPVLKDKKALTYSSYTFGDPATPIPRSYLGEPTKTLLMHPGSEQLHVHHLHGGGDRWLANPRAQGAGLAGGLRKQPVAQTRSIRLDSQTVGPGESYTLEHECGAGGCQQAAGDFLFHCHIAAHYIAGMWGIWRVFDTAQPDLAPLPGRTAPAAAVTSEQLLGRTFEGRTVVRTVTNPDTQVSLREWVEGQLPPRGARIDHADATVWDWTVGGSPAAPTYLGEPESTRTWADYSPRAPGRRLPILFNPGNGRNAWPLLRPHLGMRPPFAPNEHGGTPWLGATTSAKRPDGLCPATAPTRTYNITAIDIAIPQTRYETDQRGRIFVLNEEKDAVRADPANRAVPLVIRSNVGDCVAITLSSQLHATTTARFDDGTQATMPEQSRVNMHTHFVQFDPQGSDGIVTGFSYEQAVGDDRSAGNTTLTAAAPAGADTIRVADTDRILPGVAIAVGLAEDTIEVRTVAAVGRGVFTLDRPLARAHAAGEATGVEFVQYRWYSDVDSGTVFWHDHVDGISSWAHGLFGAHIIEPAGSTYHDPATGAPLRSGPVADIWTTGSPGVGARGSFREFALLLGNGRQGRPELTARPPPLGMDLNVGQECEESSINLRAEPIGERVPRASQQDTWNGGVCRNDYVDPRTGRLASVNATIQTSDPYVFSSVRYGDPATPVLRAYAGDPVVIRTIGTAERVEALRIQGHRFRRERFSADGELTDQAITGISERFDYVLDGGAGGPSAMPGDYLYYSTRNFALESGGWGILRVHDTSQSDLEVLPGRSPPRSGPGFPRQKFTGRAPSWPSGPDDATSPCPAGAPTRRYDVSIFDVPLPSAPTSSNVLPFPARDPDGIVYSLLSDRDAILAGTKRLEPLVLRANVGECVTVTLYNEISAKARYGGARAGFGLAKLLSNPQRSGGAAVGFNPDSTVARGGVRNYTFYADRDLGTSIFSNLGSEASLLHGAYGLFVTEPAGSTWQDSDTGAPLGPQATSTAAVISVPSGQSGQSARSFREFAVTMGTTDQHIGRSIIPYWEQVAGTTDDEPQERKVAEDEPHIPMPPGLPDSVQPGYTMLNYHSAPVVQRIGPTVWGGDGSEDLGLAFNSAHGVPDTPLFRAYAGDPVVFRVGVGASNQVHTFTVGGHEFPLEPGMWDDAHDHRSQLVAARAVAAGGTIDAELVGGAGGPGHTAGDFRYGDGRGPFVEAGLWGILRVLPAPTDTGAAPLSPAPVPR